MLFFRFHFHFFILYYFLIFFSVAAEKNGHAVIIDNRTESISRGHFIYIYSPRLFYTSFRAFIDSSRVRIHLRAILTHMVPDN